MKIAAVCLALICHAAASAQVHHFAFFGPDREHIHDEAFLKTKALEGAQMHFTWRELEPTKDHYDFSSVRSVLAFLKKNHKKLFIQLQEVTFSTKLINIPRYLQEDPRYHGGANLQYDIPGDDDSQAKPEGWAPRRWDGAVRERFAKLLTKLGAEFDGKIEGISLPETSVTFGSSGKLYPSGFTPETYFSGIVANMKALKRAFPRSVTLQYANFMPGEWLPEDNHHYLERVFAAAKQIGVGLGGPDLLPNRPAQMKHIYRFLPGCKGIVPTGIAAQDGNYAATDPTLGRPATIAEMETFARENLGVTYIFWCNEEPFFSTEVVPFLQKKK